MNAMDKHLIDIEVRQLDDLPDGAFLAVLNEKGIDVDRLVACYEHDSNGYCLCIKCIDGEARPHRGKWNGPEEEKPSWLK